MRINLKREELQTKTEMDVKRLLKGGIWGTIGGLGGFAIGFAIQALCTAAGVKGLGVPVKYILPVETVSSTVVGFASGFLGE